MKAYIVTEDFEGHCCIKFAKHNVVARREGASELNTEFEYVECRRAPEFDQYAEIGEVPIQVLIGHGWRYKCFGCGTTVHKYSEDDEGNELELYYPDDNRVYCSLQCCSEEIERNNEQKRREREVVNAALERWPGIEIVYSNVYMDPQLVEFKFSGGLYKCTWRMGQSFVSVSKTDVEAWKKFAESVNKND